MEAAGPASIERVTGTFDRGRPRPVSAHAGLKDRRRATTSEGDRRRTGCALMAEPDAVRAELDRLADGLRARDPEALTRCYELTAGLLTSIALGILRDREDAQDAVQDAFVSFVRNVGTIRGDGRSIRAWLVQAVRSRSIDRTRSAAHHREVPSDDLPDRPDPGGSDLADDLTDPAFERAFAELTETQRTAMVLYHVHGLSGQETAAAMGSNRAAVYTLLRRAEASLRRRLGDDPSDPAVTRRLSPQGGE